MSKNSLSNAPTDIPSDLINISKIKSRVHIRDNLLNIGLTGGIATGKTTVAEMFRKHGATIIDFDILARKVVEPETRGLADIVSSFGPGILNSDGSLDRKALSRIVFQDSARRGELERLLHPAIFDSFCEEVKTISQEEENSIIIAVIPLLIEMNLQPLFDKLVVVHLSSDIQRQRLMERDHIDESLADEMIRSQLPIDDKVNHADFMVDNSGDLEKTTEQVAKIWKNLLKLL